MNFKETINNKTNNAGTRDKQINVGFQTKHEAVSTLKNLSEYFKPEFLNRFDTIITFNELEEDSLLQIVDLMLADLEVTIEENEINITITDESKQQLVKLGYGRLFDSKPLSKVNKVKISYQLTKLISA